MESPWFGLGFSSLASLSGLFIPQSVSAQSIIPAQDGTGTNITINGNQFQIDGGSFSEDGKNLFHSFQEFGLSNQEIAKFLSSPQVQNILGRVIGGNPSLIDGLLEVVGSNANLYLMNPAGIVFGTNAYLNVPGDFTATTATGIGFGNGNWFNALGVNNYATLLGNPQEFVFDLEESGTIINEGDLTVNPGQNLNFISGSFLNSGILGAGKINIATVEGTNLVRITPEGYLLSFEFIPPANGTIKATDLPGLLTGAPGYFLNEGEIVAQDVEIGGRTLINPGEITSYGGEITANLQYFVNSGAITADGAGSIDIQASERILHTAGGIISATEGGNVSLHAPNYIISGTLDVFNSLGIGGKIHILGDNPGLAGATLDASGELGGGEILIGGDFQGLGDVPTAKNTSVYNTNIFADAIATGDGGKVILWADNQTYFSGSISARGGEFGGNGGFVEVSGKQGGNFAGLVDAGAVLGDPGTLLLDPKNITIADGGDTSWSLVQTLLNPTPENADNFGFSVAIDAGNIVVGTPFDSTVATSAGSAYLFDTSGSLLQTLNNPTPENGDNFGFSVAIDAGNIVVGTPFDNTGASNAGSVYLFDTSGSLLQTLNNPTPEASDTFGNSVAIDAGNVVVGALGDNTGGSSAGSAYLFDSSGSLLQTLNNPTPEASDTFGRSVAVDAGNIVVGASSDNTGATGAGSAYLFDTSGSLLQTFNNPTPENGDTFGNSVAIDAGNIVVGAPFDGTGATAAGSAYLFDTSGSLLQTLNNPTPEATDLFGISVAIDAGNIVVGADFDNTGASDAGSAYVFDSSGSLLQTLNNPTPEASDNFGNSVAIDGGNIVVGAEFDNTGASGAGAAYLYSPSPTVFSQSPGDDFTFDADFITNTTDTGTAVVLQANNDITINEDILTSEGGAGGNITFQAGRSIFVNADIDTDGGNLTLSANDPSADLANRDVGAGTIDITSDIATDSGDLTVTLGAGGSSGITFNNTSDISTSNFANITITESAGGDINFNGILDGDGGNIDITASGGNVNVNGTASISSGQNFPGGDITINAPNGSILVDGLLSTVDISANSGGVLNVTGDVTLNSTPSLGAGDINLNGFVNADLVISTDIIQGTPITLSAIGDIQINAIVQTTGNADITIIADSDSDGFGGVQVTAAGEVNSGGKINIIGSNYTNLGTVPGGLGVAIQVDDDGINNQLQAVGEITLNGSGLTSADITLQGLVTSTTGDITITSDSLINLNTAIAGGGDINFVQPVVLLGDTTIQTSSANGSITFSDTVNGSGSGENLTVATAASPPFLPPNGEAITFNGAVGNIVPLGDITLTSDEVDINGGFFAGIGDLVIQPASNTQGITLGGTVSEPSLTTLELPDSELASIQSGFTSITIGSITSYGYLYFGGDVNFDTDLTVRSPNGYINTSGYTINTTGNVTISAGQGINAASINSNGGDITLDANADGIDSGGLTLQDAVISTAGGDFTATGTGSTENSSLDIINSSIATGDGNINLTGQTSIAGVYVDSTSSLYTTGTGNITITGSGIASLGLGGSGIDIQGTVQTEDGTVDITGTVGGFVGFGTNSGISINGGTIQSNGVNDGSITLTGITTGTDDNNQGISITGGSSINLLGQGDLDITGSSGGAGTNSSGVFLNGSNINIETGNPLSFTITGNGGFSSPDIALQDTIVSTTASDSGTLIFFGNDLQFSGTTDIPVNLDVNIQPFDISADFTLTSDNPNIFSNVTQSITFGEGGYNGNITITNDLNLTQPLTILTSNTGGSITTTGTTITTTGNDLNFSSGGNISVGSLTTNGGNINLNSSNGVINFINANINTGGGDLTALGSGAIPNPDSNLTFIGAVDFVLGTTNILDAAGGNISLTGVVTGGGGYGVNFPAGNTIQTSGAGSITINGTGGTGGFSDFGVALGGTTTVEDGDITVTGAAGGGAFGLGNNTGIQLDGTNLLQATGDGNINLNGIGGVGVGNVGIAVNSSILTVDGNINLTGTGTSDTSNSVGIRITRNLGTEAVQATGSGSINISGIAPGDGGIPDSNTGTSLFSAVVRSNDGDITISGTVPVGTPISSISSTVESLGGGNVNIFETSNLGISLQDTTVTATGTGDVNLGTGNLALIGTSQIQGNAGLVLQPFNLDDDLTLSVDALNGFGDGFNTITIGAEGSNGNLVLGSDLSFAVPVTLQGSTVDTSGVTLNGTQLTLIGNDTVNLGATNITDSLTITSSGNITGNGIINVAGTTTLAGENITLDNNSNDFATVIVTNADNLVLNESNNLDLGNTNLSGNLNLATNGIVTNSGNVSVAGITTLNTNSNDLNLDSNNDFSTVIIPNGNNVTLNDVNNLDLGDSTISGNLTLSATGITDSGNLSVAGLTTFAVNGDVTLANNHDFSLVSVNSVNDITLNDESAINFNTVSATGDFTVTANGGITSSGDLSVGGVTKLDGNGDDLVLLGDNDFNTLDVTNVNNLSVNDVNSLDLGDGVVGGNLNVTTDGEITSSGDFSVAGVASFDSNGNSITLDGTNNNFATVSVSNGTFVNINNNSELDLGDIDITGDLDVRSLGDITDSGNISVTGVASFDSNGNSITLDGSNNNFATVSVSNAASVNINNNAELDLGDIDIIGDLDVSSLGNITDSGYISVTGVASIDSNGNSITFDGNNNNFATVSVSNGTSVNINNNAELDLDDIDIAGDLDVSSLGNITDSGDISVTGVVTLDANGSNIILDSSNNQFGTLQLTGNNITVNENAATDVGLSNINGNFVLNSTGEITNSGAITVLGNAQFSTTLPQTGNVSLVNTNPTTFETTVVGGDLTVNANGAVSQTPTGDIQVAGNTTINAAEVTLNNPGNVLPTFNSATGDVIINQVGNVNLDAQNVTGNLTVNSLATGVSFTDTFDTGNAISLDNQRNSFNGTVSLSTSTPQLQTTTGNPSISQTGSLNVTGDVFLNATNNGDINLTDPGNQFGNVQIIGQNVSITENDAMELGEGTVTGILTLNSQGDITQTVGISVTGIASFDSNGNNIVLDGNNNFVTVSVSNGTSVNINNSSELDLGNININSDLDVSSLGNITDSGDITVTGTASFDSNGNSITLDGTNNNFTTVSVSNGISVNINNSSELDLGDINIDSDLDVSSLGNITDSGDITVTGTASFDSNGNSITLDGTNNNFTTVAINNANNVNLNDINDLNLGDTNIAGNININTGNNLVINNLVSGGNLNLNALGNITATQGVLTVNNDANLTAVAINLDGANIGGNFQVNAVENISFNNPINVGETLAFTGNTITINNTINSGENVAITSTENLNTADINTNSPNQGGDINLTSTQGIITTGNLDTSGSSGGEIFIDAELAISTLGINSSGTSGDGGNVTLDPIGDIEVSSINAQGGAEGSGGDVNIVTQSFFRATETFTDQNGVIASISTAGGTSGGAIAINHGGNGDTPFVIGDTAFNGTVGEITSGEAALNQGESFNFTTLRENLGIFSINAPTDNSTPTQPATEVLGNSFTNTVDIQESSETGTKAPQNSNVAFYNRGGIFSNNLIDIGVEELEENLSDDYTEYFGEHITPTAVARNQNNSNRDSPRQGNRSQQEIAQFTTPTIVEESNETDEFTLSEAVDILRNVEESTGVKPAVIYVFFAPQAFDTPENSKSLLSVDPQPTDQLELVVVTGNGSPLRLTVPATRDQVKQTQKDLHRGVTNFKRHTYLKPAQQLYQWLIAPLQNELEAQGINNLVFIMDQGLRSLPMAVLHDGEGFIVEKYSVGMMPSLSLSDNRPTDIKDAQVLAMGASEFTEQNPLPSTPVELSLITEEVWQGDAFINEEFTLETLQQVRQTGDHGIVHLATHGEFTSGTPGDSYIQLSDSKLGLNQIRDLDLHNPPLELLVLSACRTALGDKNAELGFTGLAVQAGAKTAIGSLWYVSDDGTLGLMTNFYRQLREAPIKAEALRRAQLAMIQGKVRIAEGHLVVDDFNAPLPQEIHRNRSQDFSHPYFWSAFTMVGNPW